MRPAFTSALNSATPRSMSAGSAAFAASARRRRAARAAVAEPGREFLVADRLAGQVRADAGDICLSHEVHSATGPDRRTSAWIPILGRFWPRTVLSTFTQLSPIFGAALQQAVASSAGVCGMPTASASPTSDCDISSPESGAADAGLWRPRPNPPIVKITSSGRSCDVRGFDSVHEQQFGVLWTGLGETGARHLPGSHTTDEHVKPVKPMHPWQPKMSDPNVNMDPGET
jgi:hypothetical protein